MPHYSESERVVWIALIVLWGLGLSCASAGETPQPVDFMRDVRPILSNNCFQCHGPDKAARKADLRLDLRENAGKVHGAETVVDGKNLAESEIVRRITCTD